MKKVNKILMATVAILLSLVLISTSVVSGIFAKYVIKKSVEAPIIFRKFGVSLKMEVDSDLVSKIKTQKQLGDSIMVEIKNLVLSPGDDFSDALKFTISGTPNVNVKLKIIVGLAIDSHDHWQIPEGQKFESITTGSKYFLPVGFTIAANPTATTTDKYALKPWYNSSVETDFGQNSTLKNEIAAGIGSKITDSTVSGDTVSVNFPVESTKSTPKLTIGNTTTSEFYLGFEWPMEYNVVNDAGKTVYSSELLDAISVAIANNPKSADGDMTLTYRVLLEQY